MMMHDNAKLSELKGCHSRRLIKILDLFLYLRDVFKILSCSDPTLIFNLREAQKGE